MHNFVRSLLVLGLVASTPALAQEGVPTAPPPPRPPDDAYRVIADEKNMDLDRLFTDRQGSSFNAKGMKIERAEMKLLRELEKKANGADGAGGRDALSAAKAGIVSPDAKFVMAALALRLGAKLNDAAMQSEATDLVIASGRVPANVLPKLLRNQASYALDANNWYKARISFQRLVQLNPADVDSTIALAQAENNLGQPKAALTLMEKAIAMKKAAGQPVPDTWLRALQSTRFRAAAK